VQQLAPVAEGLAEATLEAAEPERTVYSGPEWEELGVPLAEVLHGGDLDIYPEVLEGRYFQIQFKSNRLAITAGGHVGLIPINDRVAIEVRPRVEIRNLERIFAIGRGEPLPLHRYIRRYAAHEEMTPSLLDALAEALIGSLERVTERGLHREYVVRTSTMPFPRGRILIGRTVQQVASRGIRHKVVSSWFEPTVDTAPNRCLKYAAWTLLQRYSRMKQLPHRRSALVAGLNGAYQFFDGVELELSRDWLGDRRVQDPSTMPSGRDYYSDALQLAVAIAREEGIRFRDQGDLALPTLLVDMDALFESYVREVLAGYFRQVPNPPQVLDGNLAPPRGGRKALFDTEPSEDATPDVVVIPSAAGRPPVIVEVKYRPLEGQPQRADLNQVIGYGVSYRAQSVVLVQPAKRAADAGMRKVGVIDKLTMHAYALDLSSERLHAVEHSLGKAIHELL
jgi:5-methylcytosine-specific restriction enzyme subunit McrC